MCVQLEFPFTYKGFLQQRAIMQDLYLRALYKNYETHNENPVSLLDFELSHCEHIMSEFAKSYPVPTYDIERFV